MVDTNDDEFTRMVQEREPILQVDKEVVNLVNLGDTDYLQMVKIAEKLEKDQLVELCREYKEVFVWTYRNMPGLDPSIITHKIPIKGGYHPIWQKLRRMQPDVQDKVKQEVMKLLEANFIRVADYPEWVANIVLVPKKEGKNRICVDYRDLNKAYLKDDFHVSHIDMVVDSAARHLRLSLVDGYSSYNQILMDERDKKR